MAAEDKTQEMDPKDLDALNTYLKEMDQLAKNEPAYDFSNPKSAEAWEKWNQKVVALNEKYHDAIVKALAASMDLSDDPHSVPEIIRALLSDDMEAKGKAAAEIHSMLLDVHHYSLMGDKTATSILAMPGTPQAIDGQMQLVWGVNQAPKNAPQVPVYIGLSNANGEITTSERITAFDNTVTQGVANIAWALMRGKMDFGPWYITPADIWRQMQFGSCNRMDKKPSAGEIRDVCTSMDKMRFTKMILNFTAEIAANPGYINVDNLSNESYKSGIIEDYYMPAAKCMLLSNKGREMIGYRVYGLPPLFDYNYAKGNLVLVDPELLDVSDTIKKSGDYVTEFKNYFLLQIQNMYTGFRDSTKILYSTVYRDTGIPTPDERISKLNYSTEESYKSKIRYEAKSDREKFKGILQSFKNKQWITDYKEVKSGKAIVGVRIILNPKRPQKALDDELALNAGK